MRPSINYTVDDEPQSTEDATLTPIQILTNAGINAADHYLVLVLNQHNQKSYKDQADEEIHMHPHMKFISVSLGPTPVS
jgi:hypothetical protein